MGRCWQLGSFSSLFSPTEKLEIEGKTTFYSDIPVALCGVKSFGYYKNGKPHFTKGRAVGFLMY